MEVGVAISSVRDIGEGFSNNIQVVCEAKAAWILWVRSSFNETEVADDYLTHLRNLDIIDLPHMTSRLRTTHALCRYGYREGDQHILILTLE